MKPANRLREARRGLVVDLFCGAGGASVGIEAALGRDVDLANNHSQVALAVHSANHPRTQHLHKDVWEVNPRAVTRGRPVYLLWASPDCTHFSKAKGGKPREGGIRSLAWVVRDWARDVRPELIFMENVEEFLDWGPLYPEGHPHAGNPNPERRGETFRQFTGALELLGYRWEKRVLDASHYGAPTRRKRLFLVFRRDGEAVRWPEATHGPGRLPCRTAAECIDWSLPCPSIFERKRPLAEKTLWRIAEGVRRFVLENPQPFVVGVGGPAYQGSPTPLDRPIGTVVAENHRALVAPLLVKVNHGGQEARGEPADAPLSTVTAARRGHALVAPTLIQTGYGERQGQAARVLDLHAPLGTVVAQGQKHALVAAFLAKHYGGVVGQGVEQPTGTITAQDHHSLVTAVLAGRVDHTEEVRAFLTTYYGEGSVGQRVDRPLRTITALARMGLVLVHGVEHQIADIGLRMLEPHELLRAQFGRFAERYDLSAATSKAARTRLIGNSVCPEVAEALVAANVGREALERDAA